MITIGNKLKNIRTRRAGVIVYTIHNNKLYFLFAKDAQYKELCDFGGGPQKGEFSIQTAIREFKEETNAIFDLTSSTSIYSEAVLNNQIAICDVSPDDYNKSMTIFFVPVSNEWIAKANIYFSLKRNREVCTIKWLSENNFRKMLNNPHQSQKLWIRTRALLLKSITRDTYMILRIIHSIYFPCKQYIKLPSGTPLKSYLTL